MTSTTAWLRSYAPRNAVPDSYLVCFPHAGGTASAYSRWQGLVEAGRHVLAVRYPGREDRLGDPAPGSLHEIASAVASELAALPPRPAVFFGHSMGASIAHETAAVLQGTAAAPRLLVVSARPPAHALPPQELRRRASDRELEATLRAMDADTGTVLDDRDLRDLVWPAIRADYDLTHDYGPHRIPALSCPVLAIGGESDDRVAPAALNQWRECSRTGFARRTFPGGHFYYRNRVREVLRVVSEHADGALREGTGDD